MSRHNPQPCAEVARPAKRRAVTHSGDECSGVENADPWYRCQATSGGIVAGKFDELLIESPDTTVEINPLLSHLGKQPANSIAGHEVRISEQRIDGLLELASTLRNDGAAFKQNGTQLVGQGRSRPDQS